MYTSVNECHNKLRIHINIISFPLPRRHNNYTFRNVQGCVMQVFRIRRKLHHNGNNPWLKRASNKDLTIHRWTANIPWFVMSHVSLYQIRCLISGHEKIPMFQNVGHVSQVDKLIFARSRCFAIVFTILLSYLTQQLFYCYTNR